MTEKPTILFLFNTSKYAYAPWLEDGRFNCVSIDYHHTDHSDAHETPQRHLRESFAQLNLDLAMPNAYEAIMTQLSLLRLQAPAMVISFATCTDLAVSGAKHFAGKLERDPQCQNRAVDMAKLATVFGVPYCVENPVGVLSTLWRKPNEYWHPHEFSAYIPEGEGEHPEFPGLIADFDLYPKKTGSWVGNGFVLPKKSSIGTQEKQFSEQFYRLGGKSARTKYIRSLTPRGWANAVYVHNHEKLLQKQLDLFK